MHFNLWILMAIGELFTIAPFKVYRYFKGDSSTSAHRGGLERGRGRWTSCPGAFAQPRRRGLPTRHAIVRALLNEQLSLLFWRHFRRLPTNMHFFLYFFHGAVLKVSLWRGDCVRAHLSLPSVPAEGGAPGSPRRVRSCTDASSVSQNDGIVKYRTELINWFVTVFHSWTVTQHQFRFICMCTYVNTYILIYIRVKNKRSVSKASC